MADKSTEQVSKSILLEWVFRAMAMLILPLGAWVVKLEVNNALQSERIQELQGDVERNSSIRESVQSNSNTLIKLETKLDGVGEDIADVKELLDR